MPFPEELFGWKPTALVGYTSLGITAWGGWVCGCSIEVWWKNCEGCWSDNDDVWLAVRYDGDGWLIVVNGVDCWLVVVYDTDDWLVVMWRKSWQLGMGIWFSGLWWSWWWFMGDNFRVSWLWFIVDKLRVSRFWVIWATGIALTVSCWLFG